MLLPSPTADVIGRLRTVARRVNVPDTRYVTVDGAHVAWSETGDGPIDLLLVFGWAWQI